MEKVVVGDCMWEVGCMREGGKGREVVSVVVGMWGGWLWEGACGKVGRVAREVVSVDHWECWKFGWYYKAAEGQ